MDKRVRGEVDITYFKDNFSTPRQPVIYGVMNAPAINPTGSFRQLPADLLAFTEGRWC
jgi:hypothetical protein